MNRSLMVAALALAAGCVRESVYTTRQLKVPVLIGPVKTLQARQPDPGRITRSVFTEVENYYFVSSHEHGSSEAWRRQGSGIFDAVFSDALASCATCVPKANRVAVGSWHMYLLFSIGEKNWADLDGSINGW